MRRAWWNRRKITEPAEEGKQEESSEWENFLRLPWYAKALKLVLLAIKSRGCAIGLHRFKMYKLTTQEAEKTGDMFRDICSKCSIYRRVIIE